MAGRKWQIAIAIVGCASALGQARGQFIPGHLYVSARGTERCPSYPNDRIYEFDPLTGESREFAVLPNQYCTGLTGLTFTSDASALRASVWLPSTILEFDGNANVGVALGPGDGIWGPLGSNNIAYDADENFYVVNDSARNIVRFPPDGSRGTIFANRSDGIHGGGPIAIAPNANLYYAFGGIREILRFTGPRQGSVFDTLPPAASGVASLAVDRSGNLFVLAEGGDIYWYEHGDPGSRELLAALPGNVGGGYAAMTLSGDERALYVAAANDVFSVDLDNRTVTELGQIEAWRAGLVAGAGIAVYVPEPSTLILLLTGLAAGARRRVG